MTTAADLADLYRDLHRHPELAFAETRTAGIVADRLRHGGFEITEAAVMHACGHDLRTTCLLGAAAELAAGRGSWRGTPLVQPVVDHGLSARSTWRGSQGRGPGPRIGARGVRLSATMMEAPVNGPSRAELSRRCA